MVRQHKSIAMNPTDAGLGPPAGTRDAVVATATVLIIESATALRAADIAVEDNLSKLFGDNETLPSGSSAGGPGAGRDFRPAAGSDSESLPETGGPGPGAPGRERL
jgi:hypothetical protein